MNSLISKGFVSISVLAFALTGCGRGGATNSEPKSAQGGGVQQQSSGPADYAPAPEAPSGADNYEYSADESAAPAAQPAPPSATAGAAPRERSAEKKSERSFDVEEE